MKNIHILPRNKPSRLHLAYDKYYYLSVKPFIQLDTKNYKSFHIYITSDEEIKEGDYKYDTFHKQVSKVININSISKYDKKIILTTDQDLINGGVQAIDDEFLEWFVKNPSCEEVEVKEKQHFEADKSKRKNPLNGVYYEYKIIIPKEELTISDEAKQRAKNYMSLKGALEPKQETLEEAAEINSEKHHYAFGQQSEFYQLGFIEGTKWQAERMYSEEEVIAIVEKSRETGLTAEYLLLTEQFKTPHIGNINRIEELKQILSQSAPLIPENIKPLQELVDEGYDPYDSAHHLQVQRMLKVIQEYISNLKLNI